MSLRKIFDIGFKDTISISAFCPVSIDSFWVSECLNNNAQSKLTLFMRDSKVYDITIAGVITDLCLSKNDDKLHASFNDHTFQEINTRTGIKTRRIKDHGYPLDSPVFTYNANQEVLVAQRGTHRIRMLSLQNNTYRSSMIFEHERVWDMSVCPKSGNVAVNFHDKVIVLKSCLHTEVYVYEGEADMRGRFHALSATFDQNGKLIVSTCYENTLHIVTIGPQNTKKVVKHFLDCIPQKIKIYQDSLWVQCNDSFQVYLT